MALPTDRISIGNVNSLGSPLFSGASSLANREQQAMGGSPANVAASRVCMPNEILNETTGLLAKNSPGQGSSTRNSTAWSYTGPGPHNWAPHRLSEFKGAYNNLPYANVVSVGTGVHGSGLFNISIGGEYAGSQQSFFMIAAVGSSPGGSWVGIGPGGSINQPVDVGTYNIYVKDYYNCGTAEDLITQHAYPY